MENYKENMEFHIQKEYCKLLERQGRKIYAG
jgi:hypothetical protein